jgi:hypothetical protein
MRKLLISAAIILLLQSSFASTNNIIKPRLKAGEVMIPIGNGKKISILTLSQLSIKDVEMLRGQKMKFADRLVFKAAQHKLLQQINNDGTISSERLIKKMKKADGSTGFHLGGFALGFLLGLIGIIIAYIINDDYKKNRVKWAWIGFALYAAIVVVLLLSGAGSY